MVKLWVIIFFLEIGPVEVCQQTVSILPRELLKLASEGSDCLDFTVFENGNDYCVLVNNPAQAMTLPIFERGLDNVAIL